MKLLFWKKEKENYTVNIEAPAVEEEETPVVEKEETPVVEKEPVETFCIMDHMGLSKEEEGRVCVEIGSFDGRFQSNLATEEGKIQGACTFDQEDSTLLNSTIKEFLIKTVKDMTLKEKIAFLIGVDYKNRQIIANRREEYYKKYGDED